MAQLDPLAPRSLRMAPNFRSASLSCWKTWRAACGHLGLHGQQLSPLSCPACAACGGARRWSKKPVRSQDRRAEKGPHPGRGNGEDFRADVAGGLSAAAGGGEKSPLHPLVLVRRRRLRPSSDTHRSAAAPRHDRSPGRTSSTRPASRPPRPAGRGNRRSGRSASPTWKTPASQASSLGKSRERSQVSPGSTLLRGGSRLTFFISPRRDRPRSKLDNRRVGCEST